MANETEKKLRERAENIVPSSNVYFKFIEAWPRNRELLIEGIEQALLETRNEALEEAANVMAQHNCTTNCVDMVPTEHCLETAMIEVISLKTGEGIGNK